MTWGVQPVKWVTQEELEAMYPDTGGVPGWFCLAHPLKCVAEGPETGDAAPKLCPKCGSQVGVTIFGPDDDFVP